MLFYRDLKPENLFLKDKSENSDIKLADFGFSVEAEGNTITAPYGTPGYMAPEVIEGVPYGMYRKL